jgi:hypothetical protein
LILKYVATPKPRISRGSPKENLNQAAIPESVLNELKDNTSSPKNIKRNKTQNIRYCHEFLLGGGKNSNLPDMKESNEKANIEIIEEIDTIKISRFILCKLHPLL